MAFLRRLNFFLRGHRRYMAASVLFGLAFAASGLVPPLLIRQILIAHAEGTAASVALPAIVGVLAVTYLGRGGARYIYGVLAHLVGYRTQVAVLTELYRHIQTLPQKFFTDRRLGGLVSRSVGDVEAIEDFVAHGITGITLAIAIPTSMLVALAVINWQLMLVALIPIPIILVLARYLSPRLRRMWWDVRAQMAEMTAVVTEGLAGSETIKAFGRERARLAAVSDRGERYRRQIERTQLITMLPTGLMEIIAGTGLILIIAVGGDLTLRGLVPVADLFVFVVYLGLIYQPITSLAEIGHNIHNAMASMDRVFALLDVTSDLQDRPGARPPDRPDWTVRFEAVDFAYEPHTPVLHGVSFEIPEGALVALVGPTGAGKTTCAKLVPRFYEATAGAVRIGDADVREVPLVWLRDHVSMVLQDVFLFEGTIRDNIAFGRPEASDDDILAVARAANVDEFAERFEDGYDSRIGERGVRLSGGQQQRIAIARALLKDAPILILDEALSSVDAETESLIREGMDRLTQDRSTLVIAHRLSTVRRADRIVVIEAGRITQTGTHEELMARGGWYANMAASQEAQGQWRLRGAPAGAAAAVSRPSRSPSSRSALT